MCLLAENCCGQNDSVAHADFQRTVDAVWRMEAAKIVATLTAAVGDVGFAEDMAAEALVDALTQWPRTRCAAQPGRVAHHRRQAQGHRPVAPQDNLDAKYAALARDLETVTDIAWDPDRIDDDVLRLIFMAAHPVLAREGQIALTLRLVGGLTPTRSPRRSSPERHCRAAHRPGQEGARRAECRSTCPTAPITPSGYRRC